MPANNYFIRLMSEIIRLKLDQNACCRTRHIIIPVYGERFDESLDSKFPKWLKRVQVRAIYWRSQFALNNKLKKELRLYFNCTELRWIHFAPPLYFLLTSILTYN